MSGMAEVIHKARWVDGIKDGALCSDEAIAEALTAAGFGPVKEAAAVALEEAAHERAERSDTLLKTMQDMADIREYELADIVRYGAYSAEAKTTAAWLSSRATAIRDQP